jgi:hypothetical protein
MEVARMGWFFLMGNPFSGGKTVRRGMLQAIVLLAGGLLAGCTFEPVKMGSLGCRPGMCLVDGQTGLLQLQLARDGGTAEINDPGEFKIRMDGPVRLSYSPYVNLFQNVGVTGTFPDGSDYFVRIDSGYPWYVGLTDTVVTDHNLAICAISDDALPIGVCRLDSLRLGDITIEDPPTLYFEQHWEVQLLGLPLWRERAVLIGLKLMEEFSYVLFDNRRNEVEFGAKDDLFDPGAEAWSAYPLKIEIDPQEQRRLMVDMPIAGKIFRVWFDTGNPGGLELASAVWEQIEPLVRVKDEKTDSVMYWQFGDVACEKKTVAKLPLGFKTIRDAEVVVLSEGGPFYDTYAAIGMDVFKRNVVVIDFGRNLLWVKER